MQYLFEAQLKALRAAALDRHLSEINSPQGPEITVAGRDPVYPACAGQARRLINFSSNDYLGLANDSRIREAALAAINEFGVGAGFSRLISGTQSHICVWNARWPNGKARKLRFVSVADIPRRLVRFRRWFRKTMSPCSTNSATPRSSTPQS